jgi:hypothetical protein
MSAANDINSKTTPVNNTKKTKRNAQTSVRARKGQSNSDDDSSASLDEGYIISNIIKLTE